LVVVMVVMVVMVMMMVVITAVVLRQFDVRLLDSRRIVSLQRLDRVRDRRKQIGV